ncbi:MAG: hypothetical protein RLZZ135_987 [Cyanobacteriota bacterium]
MQIKFPKGVNIWSIAGLMAAAIVSGVIIHYGFDRLAPMKSSKSSTQSAQNIAKQVVAVGRLEPKGKVIKLSAPSDLETDRVAKLLVESGEQVQAGQVIAILAARDRSERSLSETRQQVNVAKRELAQVRAGAKSGEIAAQKAEIIRLQAELDGEVRRQQATLVRLEAEANNASVELNRYQMLNRKGAISASRFNQQRLAYRTTQAQVNEARQNRSRTIATLQAQILAAKATLSRIAEVRPVDVQVAQSKIEQAIAAAKRVEAELQQAYIRAPMTGRVIKIHTYPGEKVDTKGIVELGRTEQMMAVAEVYQTDISKIRVGQSAIITSQAFPDKLRGTVTQVESQVNRQTIMSNQPGENLDRRVIEVNVRLTPAASQQVAKFTNLQVEVAIQI